MWGLRMQIISFSSSFCSIVNKSMISCIIEVRQYKHGNHNIYFDILLYLGYEVNESFSALFPCM